MRELVQGDWLIRLYPAIRTLSEIKMRLGTASPRGKPKAVVFRDNAERDRALARRVDELLAAGWTDRATAKASPEKKAVDLEPAFAKLVEQTIQGLRAAETAAQDAAVWRRAKSRYGQLKVKAGGDATEHLVHFFAVDGIALERKHPVVVAAVKATKARKAAWLKTLGG